MYNMLHKKIKGVDLKIFAKRKKKLKERMKEKSCSQRGAYLIIFREIK